MWGPGEIQPPFLFFYFSFLETFLYICSTTMKNNRTMSKKLRAIISMIEKLDSPDKIWLGELLLDRARTKLTPEELAEAQGALYLQKIFTDILFI